MSLDAPAGGKRPNDERVETRIEEALAAHGRGWSLTPMRGKRPILKNWPSLPAPSPGDLEGWVRQGNLGLRTGAASGIIVIDDDTDDHSAAKTLDLPRTVTAVTGSGGLHHYFRTGDHGIGNSAGKLAEKVDVRGEGGVIVYPGSVHPETGEVYRWQEGHDPNSIEVAALPEHLVELLRPTLKRAPVTGKARIQSVAIEQLEAECARVREAQEGQRNDTLNRAAYLMGGFVAHGAIESSAAYSGLVEAAQQCGLEPDAAASTVRSGLSSGVANPLDRSELLERAGVIVGSRDAELPGPPQDADGRPEICVTPGSLPEIAAEAETVLAKADPPIVFVRGGLLVRTVRTQPVAVADAIARLTGRLAILDVTLDWLRLTLTRLILFLRFDKKEEVWLPVDCPLAVVKAVMAMSGAWTARPLLAIVSAPTLRPDGTVIDRAGYDATTGLIIDTCGMAFDQVPEFPTQTDAVEALAELDDVLKGFPFNTPADRSVALAAILTGLVRPMLPTAPLFVFAAPTMGSGKTLLADVVALIGTGNPAAPMPQGKNEEEQRKRLLAIFKEGNPVAVIDNVDRPLEGGPLCAALTSQVFRDRVLGSTLMATYPTSVTWIATGNNVIVRGDLVSRTLVAYLDAGVERPEERHFDIDLRKLIPKIRARLVVAGLTLLRGHIVAGRPKMGLTPFGRFEDWSDLVRCALVWAGRADPCDVRVRLEEGDPERETLRSILSLWFDALGHTAVTVSELTERADDGHGRLDPLRAALTEVSSDAKGAFSSRKLGNWIRHRQGRIVGGLRFMQAGKRHNVAAWAVEEVGPDGSSDPGPSVPKAAESAAHRSQGRRSAAGERRCAAGKGGSGGSGGSVSARQNFDVRVPVLPGCWGHSETNSTEPDQTPQTPRTPLRPDRTEEHGTPSDGSLPTPRRRQVRTGRRNGRAHEAGGGQ